VLGIQFALPLRLLQEHAGLPGQFPEVPAEQASPGEVNQAPQHCNSQDGRGALQQRFGASHALDSSQGDGEGRTPSEDERQQRIDDATASA
jgi:hypothetical protein